ncbi:MAG: GGDEF domain-containing protein [Spirochaetaceae bacterium]|nr:GGDEF domain-containing protein [Spirochaetaceae bacterium]
MENESAFVFKLKVPKLRFFPALALSMSIVAVLGFADFAVLVNGFALGAIVSFTSAAVWLVADITAGAAYSSNLIPFWNAIVRLGYFLLHSSLMGKLMDMIAAVRDLSLNDPLTKAANWRFFEEYANKTIKSAIREKRPLTLAFLDLDNFKSLNDRLGHSVGDEALLLVAQTIRADIRPQDMLARLGGDEFVLLIPGADFKAADAVLKRLHEALTNEMGARGWGITASVGAVTFTTLSSTIGALLERADKLMYEVKKDGKNALRHQAWP